jgi:hypothetical protein
MTCTVAPQMSAVGPEYAHDMRECRAESAVVGDGHDERMRRASSRTLTRLC